MRIRIPARAGSFYEGAPDACRRHAQRLLQQAVLPPQTPPRPVGGLVPHAGWMFSGPLAAMTLKALAAGGYSTFVLLGADHTGAVARGEVFAAGAWRTPIGDAAIDEELAGRLLAAGGGLLRDNGDAHAAEHSLEVQVPLLLTAAPAAKIVPIAVPPTAMAVEIGEAVGAALAAGDGRACVVGSTDLTHHGGHFGNYGGRGSAGLAWSEQNDARMLELITAMDAAAIVPESQRRANACGAGAIAAAIAACRKLGATRGVVLEYTNSHRVLRQLDPGQTDDTTVGYASVLFA